MPNSDLGQSVATEFRFGRENKRTGGWCCGKPVGCTMTHDGCCYLRHPWKRANVFHEPDAPCTKSWLDPVAQEWRTCSLSIEHEGGCKP